MLRTIHSYILGFNMMKKKTIEKLTIVLFLSVIGILSLCNLFKKDIEFSENENRPLAKVPSLSLEHVFGGHFDDDFETWFTDQFIGRDTWISMKSLFKKATGSIENNDVYYGKEEYLIRRFQTYPQKTLQQNIEVIQDFVEAQDIQMNILLIPTICNTQQALLPSGSWNIDQNNLIKQVYNALPNQNMLWIKSSLSNHNDVYYKTDHHWNEKGAYLAYEEIAKNVLHKEPNRFTYELVSDSFYGTMYSRSGAFWSKPDSIYKIIPSEDYTVEVNYDNECSTDSLYSEEKLKEKDKYTYYVDGNHPYVQIKSSNHNGKHAVIIKDSYAHILLPYLVSEYEEIEMVDLRYYHDSVSNLIKENSDIYFIYSIDNFAQDPNVIFLE